MLRILLFIALLLAAVLGCKSSAVSPPASAKPAILSGSDAEIRQRLLVEIPIGTALENAAETIEKHGLRYSQEADKKTGDPYLSCGYSEKSGFWVTFVWQIRIDCPGGVVSEIQCKQTGIGP